MSIQSAGSSPSNLFDPTQTISQGRKRQRSQSMQSDSGASTSSAKRSTTDNSSDPRARSPLTDQPISVPSDINHDLDAYMAGSGGLDVPSIVSPPSYHESTTQAVSPNEKLQIVQKGLQRKMEVGETWYIVSCVWYKRWKKACTGEVDKEGPVIEQELGPVNNSRLLDPYGNLLRSLAEGVDVQYVPEEVWNLFEQWYGIAPHPLPRKIIARGILKEASLELYPLQLRVFKMVKTSSDTADTPSRYITISAGETITTLCSQLCYAVAITTAQDIPYRIWKLGVTASDPIGIEYPASQLVPDAKIVDASDKTLGDDGIESEDAFIVEFKQDDGWIAEVPRVVLQPAPVFNSGDGFFNKMSSHFTHTSAYKSNFYGASSSFSAMGSSFSKTPSVSLTLAENNKNFMKTLEPGTLGLGNMGNTCFMNSALQCLGHTKELTDYFLSRVFESEINRDNPLGMGGAIAEAFGALLTRMWASTGVSTSYSPREFKIQLQRFAPQFSGYQQHDSQELVAFLLDGLHEDLNRVLKKPYVEKPDWEGGDDLELVMLAQKSWEGYMKRNDSIIVDLFQGQYQSTLVCPECKKVSITFDPFMYLTLPLPVQRKWKHTIFYVPWNLDKPHLRVPVEIHRDASFKDLRTLLGRWLNAPSENLLTLEIFNNRFYKNLDDTVLVGDMADNDVIVCFELPCNARQSRTYKKKSTDPAIVPVYFCDTKPPIRSAYFALRTAPSLFGYPIVVAIDEEQAKDVDAMYEAIVTRLQRWTANARDLFDWEVDHSTDFDAVQVKINGYLPVESIAEIREDGKVVTITPSPEGDALDEKRMIVDVEDDLACEGLLPRKKGVKKGIFDLRLQVNHKDYGITYSNYMSSTRWVSWEDRQLETDTDSNLLRDDDAFYCEFDEDKKFYFFGEGPKPEHALWDRWELFVHPELEEARKVAVEKRHKGISLQDCLEEFTKREQLGEDDLWYCPQCKKHQQATKKFDLWKAPDILVVHLKRFSNNRILRDKIDTHVEFPIEGLDLGDAVQERAVAKRLLDQGVDIETLGLGSLDEPLVYDLYAVDEHIGGLGGGHYRAYAENHQTAKWYHFDDSFVTPARASDSVNANAYLLFYRRRTDSQLGGKSRQSVKDEPSEPPQINLDGGLNPSIDLPDSQLPTPPNEPTPATGTTLLSDLASTVIQPQLLESNNAWHLRPAGSNAGSSVPSPPLEDLADFEDYQPYPQELLRQSYDFADAALKASPSSSNAADADIDTDLDQDDAEWDSQAPMSNHDVGDNLSQNETYSDQVGWIKIHDVPFSEVNGRSNEDLMDTRDHSLQG